MSVENQVRNFLLPEKGKNQWWRYLLGSVLVVASFFIAAIVASLFLYNFDSLELESLDIDPILIFALSMLPHVTCFFMMVFIVKVLHKRSLKSLITPYEKISYRKIFIGFWLFGILLCIESFVNYLWFPENFSVEFDAETFFPFLFIVCLITPIQTTFEELFFRGYLLQWMGKLRPVVILSIINGIMFMLPHLGNPEMGKDPVITAAVYFVMGFFLAIIAIRTNGLEYVIGVHAVNNLYCGLIVNYERSALETESIFLNSVFNPAYSLIAVSVMFVLFLYFLDKPFFNGNRWRLETRKE